MHIYCKRYIIFNSSRYGWKWNRQPIINMILVRHLFFQHFRSFSHLYSARRKLSFLSVNVNRILISEAIPGARDKRIRALAHEDVHTTHCQLTPVDLPTRDTYAATYLWESGVKSSRAFFSLRFPAGILLYVRDVSSMLYSLYGNGASSLLSSS